MTTPSTPKDNFNQNLVQYLLERQSSRATGSRGSWLSSLPVADDRAHRELVKNNPFHPDRIRPSSLTVEVPRLYAAISFAMWKYGVVMNSHLTICWRLLGITHNSKAAEYLSCYNHEAAKWLKVGVGDKVERQRASRRASWMSAPHIFVYVHEQARDKGFHTHELMCLPPGRAQEFAEWSRDCLGRLTGKLHVDEQAVFFSPASAKLKQFKPYEGAREPFAVDRQWRWFRYITKSLHPSWMERSPNDPMLRPSREIFQITKPFVETGTVTSEKLAGYSQNISPAAQRRAGFVSKFKSGDWANLYNGSELDDYRAWSAKAEKQKREAAEQAAVKGLLDRLVI